MSIAPLEPALSPLFPASRRSDRGRLAWGTVFLFLLVFAVYSPVWGGGFVWDDPLLLDKNPLVTGKLGLGSIWFRTDFPLSMVVLWLERLAWGKNAAGYHLVNLLCHAVGSVLVWRVLGRLRILGAWLAAALFAVHPVGVASAAWISELKNTLSLPLFLLAILCYLRFEEAGAAAPDAQPPPARGRGWYWLSLGAFLLALLAKTSTVMLPVVLLGCAWWQRRCLARKDWLRTLPYFGLALAFGLLTIWFQQHGAIAGKAVQSENLWGRLAGAGTALWFYLGKALLPVNLNAIYPHWEINPAAGISWLPLLLWCGVLALCWRFRRGWGGHLLLGLGYFTVTLFPVLGFFDMYFLALSRVSDHFAYLALVGVVGLAAAGLRSLPGRQTFRLAGTILVLALSVLTWRRAQVFASDESLWRDTLARNPAAWTAHNNLGSILAEQHKYAEAESQFDASLQINPDNAQAHCNLGRILDLRGDFAGAQSQFLAALALKPKEAEFHQTYGHALARRGDYLQAIEHLQDAVRLEPGADARLELATLLYQTGNSGQAVAQYRQLLALHPDLPQPLSNLAWLLATSPDDTVRNGAEAVHYAERACRLTHFRAAQMLGVLAAAYAEAGRFPDAVGTAGKAIELATAAGNSQFADANRQLLALYRAGKPYHETPRR